MNGMDLMRAEESRKVPITVQRIQNIGNGRFKIKIRETSERLVDLTIDGFKYDVTRQLGRGRYVVRRKGREDGREDSDSQIQG